ncbi:MAG: RDD family protein [Bacteroidota bacterium]
MESQEQVLDFQQSEEVLGERHVIKHMAGSGKRLVNHIIDSVVTVILIFLYTLLLGLLGSTSSSQETATIVGVLFVFGSPLLTFFYYVVMEASFGKTVGKFLTRTRVVTHDGRKPSTLNIIGRTLCRWIPFEALSFLNSEGKGWHDSISRTNVIEI